ncbi:LysR substrate-binding domain-containing protein [Jatrophihabitans telluris]|uniref:LysR substrate-binding domain-containing protein n=1 Tax=Jatrophihabitans telluris TaxID=2038343 RepID=A0ABY4R1Y2_9ACTN|nr:LysR substrate-binding domain-containing protein [Jatrophihabitans telluris]UQX89049.1 LysR substrate-binding domain-containing protein [Jatrophihabitans telluris]
MLDPQQLRLLQEVARTGSYSAAARELGFTQPAITYQMRVLEKSVGVPLTVRTGRTMALTSAGQALLAHADRILAAIRAAENDLESLAASGTGLVRLAAFPSSCATVVPSAMAAMRRRYPNVEVQLVQAEPPHAQELVRRGVVDIALCYRFSGARGVEAGEHSGLEQREVLVETMHLILPMDHPSASRRLVGLEQLREATFIIASPQFEDRLYRAAAEAGFTPKILMVADDYVVMQALVAAGFGIALVPDLALRAHRDPRIVSRMLIDWPQRHILVELWPDMLRVEAVRALTDQLAIASAQVDTRRPSGRTSPATPAAP